MLLIGPFWTTSSVNVVYNPIRYRKGHCLHANFNMCNIQNIIIFIVFELLCTVSFLVFYFSSTIDGTFFYICHSLKGSIALHMSVWFFFDKSVLLYIAYPTSGARMPGTDLFASRGAVLFSSSHMLIKYDACM